MSPKAPAPKRFRKGDRVRHNLYDDDGTLTPGGMARVTRVEGNVARIIDDGEVEECVRTFDAVTGKESPPLIPGLYAKLERTG